MRRVYTSFYDLYKGIFIDDSGNKLYEGPKDPSSVSYFFFIPCFDHFYYPRLKRTQLLVHLRYSLLFGILIAHVILQVYFFLISNYVYLLYRY